MTILGCQRTEFRNKLVHSYFLIAAIAVATTVLNILLTVFRSDATHGAFLAINIVSDIAVVWFIYAFAVLSVIPKIRLLRLYERGEKNGKKSSGVVKEISDKTICIQGYPCLKVTLLNDDVQTEFYLIEHSIKLQSGKVYQIESLENMIYSVEEVI